MSARPNRDYEVFKRMTLPFEQKMYDKINDQAKINRRSITAEIMVLLDEAIQAREKKEK